MATKQPKDALESYTGKDARWWMLFVQRGIAKCAGPVQKDGHSRMKSYDWVGMVVGELFKRGFPEQSGPYDPNLRIAYLTSLVLAAWYSRVHHSKTFDPRRPKRIRQRSYESWRNATLSFVRVLFNDEHDPRVFNGIPFYENPYDPKSKSGKFV